MDSVCVHMCTHAGFLGRWDVLIKLGAKLTDSANLSLNPGCALLLGDIRQVYVSVHQ